jgi:hypothetical protein
MGAIEIPPNMDDIVYGFESSIVPIKSKREFLDNIRLNHPLSNKDIEFYIKFKDYVKYFQGFVSASGNSFENIRYADPLKNKQFYIVFSPNPSRSDRVGHWTLIQNLDGDVYTFNSSGNRPNRAILNYFRKNMCDMEDDDGKLEYNSFDMQNQDSALCGYYVLYILDNVFEGNKDIGSIIEPFSEDNFEKNHRKLYKHFMERI